MFKALRRKIKKNRTLPSNVARSEGRLHDVVLQPALRPGAPRMKEKDVPSKNAEKEKYNISGDHINAHNSELEDFKELLTSADINARFEKDDNTNNRIHNEHYVYDSSAYRVMRGDDKEVGAFDVFEKPGGLTPAAVRYVVFQLVACFMEHLDTKLSKKKTNETYMIRSAMEIFKPNLSHYSASETQETKQILSSLFPCDGCSLAGETLKNEINRHFKGNWNRLILALRLIWSHLSEGIIPWESFLSFRRLEEKHHFPLTAFYTYLPQVLPSSDHTYLAYSFLEILVAIIGKTDLVVEKSTQMDLVFTAGQVCFAKSKQMERYREEGEVEVRGSVALGRTYYIRGAALYHLFVAYLRSLMNKGLIKDFYLIDNFNVGRYPPESYKPMMQQALTLTVPKFQQGEDARNDFNRLLKLAAKASTRIYSSQHAFSKVENTFLDQFEEDPARTIAKLFSKSSIRYLYKFDKGFNTNYFKTISDKNSWNRALQELDASDQYAVATWIESCKQHGFNEFLSILDNSATGEATLALGSPQFTAVADELFNERNEESHPVRISKMGISEWFISSWKYEMFLGKIHNTVVVKLTKRIGNCDWLVISTDDRVLKTDPNALPSLPRMDVMKNGMSQMGTPNTPSTTEFGAESPRTRMSEQIKRHRPPPLNLLGQASTSPLMADSASSLQLRKSSVAGSVTTKDTWTEEGSISENPSGVPQTTSAPSSVGENVKGDVELGNEKMQPKLSTSATISSTQQRLPMQEPGDFFTPTNPTFDYSIVRPAAPKKAQNPSLSSFKKLTSEREIPVITEEEPDLAVHSSREANNGSEASFYTVSSASDAIPSNTSDLDATRTECASSVEVRHISKPVYFSGGIAHTNGSQTLKVTTSVADYSRRQTPLDFQELSGDAPLKEVVTPGSRGTMLVYPKNEDCDEEASQAHNPTDTKNIKMYAGDSQEGTIQEPGDFLDDFIDGYKEGTEIAQNIEMNSSSGEDPTLFEKVKQYYENHPASSRGNSDIRPKHSESADTSGNANGHEEMSVVIPTTPTAQDPAQSQTESIASGFSIKDGMTTIDISPLKVCPPKVFLANGSNESSDSLAEQQPVSRFKNVLLKTKRSIRDLGNSLST